jgi:hypothetical protein
LFRRRLNVGDRVLQPLYILLRPLEDEHIERINLFELDRSTYLAKGVRDGML